MISQDNLIKAISTVDKTTYLQLLAQHSNFDKTDLGDRRISFDANGLVSAIDEYGIVVTLTIEDVAIYANRVDPDHRILRDLFQQTYLTQIEMTDMDVGEYIIVISEICDYLSELRDDGYGLDITECPLPYIDVAVNVLLEINKDNLMTAFGFDSHEHQNLVIIHRVTNVDSYYCRSPYPGMIEYGSLSSNMVINQNDRIIVNEIPFNNPTMSTVATKTSHLMGLSIKLVSIMSAILSLRKNPELFV